MGDIGGLEGSIGEWNKSQKMKEGWSQETTSQGRQARILSKRLTTQKAWDNWDTRDKEKRCRRGLKGHSPRQGSWRHYVNNYELKENSPGMRKMGAFGELLLYKGEVSWNKEK